MRQDTAYRRVKKIADGLGWPTHYRDDLVKWDRGGLRGHHGPFLWSVQPTGTHLATPGSVCAMAQAPTGRELGAAWRNITRRYYSPEARTYHFDGTSMREITGAPDKAQEILRGWLDGCQAPTQRKREVLAGIHGIRRR